MSLNEEKITEVMKEFAKGDMFKEVFGQIIEERLQHVINLISANHVLENQKIDELKEEIKTIKKEIKAEVVELRESLQFFKNSTEKAIERKNRRNQ